jgi:two-component system capsular synthesis response regulator RcsB
VPKPKTTKPKTPIENRPLSPREIEVAKLLALGKHHREIAKELDISPKTVDSHRAAALAKLKLPNNVLLARHAISVGWVPVPSIAN